MSEIISEIGRVHLRWSLVEGVGPITFDRIQRQFGDAEQALGVSAQQLGQVSRIGPNKADNVARQRHTVDIEPEISLAGQHGVRIICAADEEYPEALKRIADPPIVLYVKGELRRTDAIAIAIVGTRRCSIYGSEQARRFGELLAQAGFTVVSGLARGIDALAHHGAVEAGGRSIAVLGNGLTEIYPPENGALAAKLMEKGALVSELPMQSSVERKNFPTRNRIIAGLSLGTLVVEAPTRSGALITARLANDYNREVFVVPGRLQEPAAAGTNVLIRDGIGKLVTCLEDILGELGELGYMMHVKLNPPDSAPAEPPPAGSASTPPTVQLTAAESRVFNVVGFDAMLQDAVMAAADLPPGDVLAALTGLELKGLIRRLPGQLVVRAGKA